MTPKTLIHQRVEQARAGAYPKTIARMKSGWAVLGDTQYWRGYSLLLPDPVVAHLNDFSGAQRLAFLDDMAALGDAVLAVTGALRINYAMYGNLEPALHTHVFPRYAHEPEDLRTKPVWLFGDDAWKGVPFDLDRDRAVMDEIKARLVEAGRVVESK